MTDKNSTDNRRKLLKSITVASAAGVVVTWQKPIINAVLLPAHAETSTSVCGDSIVANTTYTQSSVYVENTAATNSTMTNGVFDEASSTGTNDESLEFVMMDLGAIHEVCNVVVGCDLNTTLGEADWGPEYTENRNVEYSTNSSDWSLAFNTGTFDQGIQTYGASFSARYIRIVNSGDDSNYLAVTEFYALVIA